LVSLALTLFVEASGAKFYSREGAIVCKYRRQIYRRLVSGQVRMSPGREIVLPTELQAAKAQTRAMVTAAGGQERCAMLTGKSQGRISDYCSRNTRDFMAINDVAMIEGVTHGLPGHPHVTRWLASEAGFLLVAKPRASGVTLGDLHSALARDALEHGQASSRAIAALADGRMTSREAREVLREIDDEVEALVSLRMLIAQVAEEPT
jgi:hypothetical protein